MTTRMLGGTIAVAVALFATGCTETIDSKNLRTAGIAALIEVESTDGTSSEVVATLLTGGAQSNTYVDLSSGDAIYASAGGGDRVEMGVESTGVYQADFRVGAEGTEFVVSLERVDDDGAPRSAGTLPAPFALNPVPPEDASRAEAFTITWTGTSSDPMEIEVDGDCIFSDTFEVPGDPGSFTIPANELSATSSDKAETCNVTVSVTRSRTGDPDPAFDPESRVDLRQVRTTTFVSAP
ncbi:hypothetical protein [Chondromyces apiculatus]|uniref:Lipoprotein n=1 Tax=Chondromyces apiculatus DSM 436 TaxID=1192034 RepID=A0A017T3B9_9BACT|nr:hypothetical protein [Chondromyces apiculatus]EYF03733.1 Hypothetical protein CAP_5163 [Chondromyces apiculatus DSM 436]